MVRTKRRAPVRQRILGPKEAGARAARLIKANKELFRRLAGGPATGEPSCADLARELIGSVRGGPRDASTNKRYLEEAVLADAGKVKRTIKLTVRDYRKTLRELASGPRRNKRT